MSIGISKINYLLSLSVHAPRDLARSSNLSNLSNLK